MRTQKRQSTRRRWLRFGQTKFGSMIEIDDEGHWTMPIRAMGRVMQFLDCARSAQSACAWW